MQIQMENNCEYYCYEKTAINNARHGKNSLSILFEEMNFNRNKKSTNYVKTLNKHALENTNLNSFNPRLKYYNQNNKKKLKQKKKEKEKEKEKENGREQEEIDIEKERRSWRNRGIGRGIGRAMGRGIGRRRERGRERGREKEREREQDKHKKKKRAKESNNSVNFAELGKGTAYTLHDEKKRKDIIPCKESTNIESELKVENDNLKEEYINICLKKGEKDEKLIKNFFVNANSNCGTNYNTNSVHNSNYGNVYNKQFRVSSHFYNKNGKQKNYENNLHIDNNVRLTKKLLDDLDRRNKVDQEEEIDDDNFLLYVKKKIEEKNEKKKKIKTISNNISSGTAESTNRGKKNNIHKYGGNEKNSMQTFNDENNSVYSDESTKVFVNKKNRVNINMCENPCDMWYGLKLKNGKTVYINSFSEKKRTEKMKNIEKSTINKKNKFRKWKTNNSYVREHNNKNNNNDNSSEHNDNNDDDDDDNNNNIIIKKIKKSRHVNDNENNDDNASVNTIITMRVDGNAKYENETNMNFVQNNEHFNNKCINSKIYQIKRMESGKLKEKKDTAGINKKHSEKKKRRAITRFGKKGRKNKNNINYSQNSKINVYYGDCKRTQYKHFDNKIVYFNKGEKCHDIKNGNEENTLHTTVLINNDSNNSNNYNKNNNYNFNNNDNKTHMNKNTFRNCEMNNYSGNDDKINLGKIPNHFHKFHGKEFYMHSKTHKGKKNNQFNTNVLLKTNENDLSIAHDKINVSETQNFSCGNSFHFKPKMNIRNNQYIPTDAKCDNNIMLYEKINENNENWFLMHSLRHDETKMNEEAQKKKEHEYIHRTEMNKETKNENGNENKTEVVKSNSDKNSNVNLKENEFIDMAQTHVANNISNCNNNGNYHNWQELNKSKSFKSSCISSVVRKNNSHVNDFCTYGKNQSGTYKNFYYNNLNFDLNFELEERETNNNNKKWMNIFKKGSIYKNPRERVQALLAAKRGIMK